MKFEVLTAVSKSLLVCGYQTTGINHITEDDDVVVIGKIKSKRAISRHVANISVGDSENNRPHGGLRSRWGKQV
jgi:hypothetical protein